MASQRAGCQPKKMWFSVMLVQKEPRCVRSNLSQGLRARHSMSRVVLGKWTSTSPFLPLLSQICLSVCLRSPELEGRGDTPLSSQDLQLVVDWAGSRFLPGERLMVTLLPRAL